jgi:hypothetical protein
MFLTAWTFSKRNLNLCHTFLSKQYSKAYPGNNGLHGPGATADNFLQITLGIYLEQLKEATAFHNAHLRWLCSELAGISALSPEPCALCVNLPPWQATFHLGSLFPRWPVAWEEEPEMEMSTEL